MKGVIQTDYLIINLQGKTIYFGKDIIFVWNPEFNSA